MPQLSNSRSNVRAAVAVGLLLLGAAAGPACADGVLDSVSADVETLYSFISTRTRDDAGTTKNEISSYGTRFTLRLNHDILPKLNLDAGGTYEGVWSNPSGGEDTEITRLLPYVWLNLRDPLLGASIGYSLQDERVKTQNLPATTLTRETYSTNVNWRPTDLPLTQVRYTRTLTHDDDRDFLDTTQDFLFLKSEYRYRGLDVYYTGTYLNTMNHISDFESRQTSHEGALRYDQSFLDGLISFGTDNRVSHTDFKNTTELPVPPNAGLSAIDDTPIDGALAPNPALIDGNRTTSAGINIGFPGLGGSFDLRNVGLDFVSPVEVNRLLVWVDGWGPDPLPADIATWFSWDVYTSTDNLTWAFHAKVQPALFGPFDRRFEINFPSVTTRYLKVVTRPLPGGVIGSTNSSLYPNILVTEVEALVNKPGSKRSTTGSQTTQNYNLSFRAILLRSPSVYYQFNGYYYESDPGSERRYNMSHGVFLNHRLTPMLTASANTSFEMGKERGDVRKAVLYYASLAATPLSTLTDSLIFTGNNQWVGDTTTTTNSVALYNTAQLYRGIDATLNLGAVFSSNEAEDGVKTRRRDLYLNVGTGLTPHPTLSLSTYYVGKLSHASGDNITGSSDTTEHRLDLGLSFSPTQTLSMSAAVNVSAGTDQETRVIQNYGLSWAPFPDGSLQFAVYYSENYFPESSRLVQPSVRWYLGPRRRSYLEASYQFNTTETGSGDTRSHLISTGLRLFF